MAIFIARSLARPGVNPLRIRPCNPITNPSPFADVPNNHPACGHIKGLYDAGIIQGCAASPIQKGQPAPTVPLFCPNDSVLRSSMAIFISRGMVRRGIIPPNGEPTCDPVTNPDSCLVPCDPVSHPSPFTDVPNDHIACKYIVALYDFGVVQGCLPGVYCPSDFVIRGSMATFITKGFNLALYTP